MAAPSPVPPSPRQPTLDCDLVMKGGITSGVVYPKAVVRIARDYTIHSIGGTSVGAIAAGLTAAAEYWRRTAPRAESDRQQAQIEDIVGALDRKDDAGKSGWDDWSRADVQAAERALTGGGFDRPGFAGLYAIPQEVGADLVGKFHPTPRTRGAFEFLLAVLDAATTPGRIVIALTRQFYLVRTVAAVVAALFTLAFLGDARVAMVPLAAVIAAGFFLLARDRYLAGRQRAGGQQPTDPGIPTVAVISVLLGLAWIAMVQVGVGWGTVFRWLADNWLLVLAILGCLVFVAMSDEARRRLIRIGAGADPAKQAAWRKWVGVGSVALGAAILVLLLWWQWDAITSHPSEFGALALGATIGWVIGGAAGLLLNALIFIPQNDNGICTGLQVPDSGLVARFPWLKRLPGSQARALALTDWLTAKIDAVAGKQDGHLTFRDLAEARVTLPGGEQYGIVLEAVTSELQRGLPLNIPDALGRYGFRPKEFQRFFPRSVVQALLVDPVLLDTDEIVRFPPDGQAIPVVVGVRMSMSFPVLFSTVPVYHLGKPGDESMGDRKPARAPLSDGGIVSNFPIHKFDRALSPWPTFAIDLIPGDGDLATTPPDDQYALNPIRVSRLTATQPKIQQANALTVMKTSGTEPVKGLVALASHILNTARGWIDNSQKTLPGYAERIVGVRLYAGEGGLNLAMTHETIERLANRGMRAVDRLVNQWDPARGTTSQWHQHRWLRYRILLRSLENLGQEWKTRYAVPDSAGQPSIKDLVATTAGGGDNQPAAYAYRWEQGAFGASAATLTGLFDAFAIATPGPKAGEPGSELQPTAGTFDGEFAPVPEPDLLMVPPWE